MFVFLLLLFVLPSCQASVQQRDLLTQHLRLFASKHKGLEPSIADSTFAEIVDSTTNKGDVIAQIMANLYVLDSSTSTSKFVKVESQNTAWADEGLQAGAIVVQVTWTLGESESASKASTYAIVKLGDFVPGDLSAVLESVTGTYSEAKQTEKGNSKVRPQALDFPLPGVPPPTDNAALHHDVSGGFGGIVAVFDASIGCDENHHCTAAAATCADFRRPMCECRIAARAECAEQFGQCVEEVSLVGYCVGTAPTLNPRTFLWELKDGWPYMFPHTEWLNVHCPCKPPK